MKLTSQSSWTTGQRVKGVYHGHAFTGVITDQTRPTPDYRNVQFHIRIDKPFTLYGKEKDSVVIMTNSSDDYVETVD